MLKQDEVDQEEERLRQLMVSLPDESRARLYRALQKELKDPDTYAVLNWFFLVGLHHFYLYKWREGLFDVALFVVGVALIILQMPWAGGAVLLGLGCWELWALFRSQIIVQDWNNRLHSALIQQELRSRGTRAGR